MKKVFQKKKVRAPLEFGIPVRMSRRRCHLCAIACSQLQRHLFHSAVSRDNALLKASFFSKTYFGIASSGDDTAATSFVSPAPNLSWRPLLPLAQVFGQSIAFSPAYRSHWFHSSHPLCISGDFLAPVQFGSTGINYYSDCASTGSKKRKKLKGKRAVVRWLKFFRWRKKKEFARMTEEEKLLYKLNLAQKKEERLVTALKKLEPELAGGTTHDPEILTPEEHFFFLKKGMNSKNIVPIGRRGVYQGVILNMHLHWKKHQTLKVVVKTFTQEEVKEVAVELSRLTGGIVLHIDDKRTIIMYRGKNYTQPPTEIMSPAVSLPRMKAVQKSKYRDALRAVRLYIPKLEHNISLLGLKLRGSIPRRGSRSEEESAAAPITRNPNLSKHHPDPQRAPKEQKQLAEDEGDSSLSDLSESDLVPDVVDAELMRPDEEEEEFPLYLNELDKFLAKEARPVGDSDGEIPPGFDEVDRLFLNGISLLNRKKNRRRR